MNGSACGHQNSISVCRAWCTKDPDDYLIASKSTCAPDPDKNVKIRETRKRRAEIYIFFYSPRCGIYMAIVGAAAKNSVLNTSPAACITKCVPIITYVSA